MESVDLNLLVALDALLEEGSVTGAAVRLRTSAPAMNRTLGRLRRAYGDPLLVRAGRGLVPTPLAIEIRDEVRDVVRAAQAVLTRTPAPSGRSGPRSAGWFMSGRTHLPAFAHMSGDVCRDPAVCAGEIIAARAAAGGSRR